MIHYLETSALLKLYLDETGSSEVRAAVSGQPAFTHIVAYAELRAGLAKAKRMKRVSEADYRNLIADLEADWLQVHVVGVNAQLVRRAGALADSFALRGYDSVHLAAAESLTINTGASLRFLCFDRALNQWAASLGMQTVG
jgi:predicted nucleic acid-binding protein